MALLRLLDQRHPDYCALAWSELHALAKGGETFRAHLPSFLPPNPAEMAETYTTRLQSATYTPYPGSIANLIVGWLFAGGVEMSAYYRDSDEAINDPSPFYGRLQENVGDETTLAAFMRERFREALITDTSYFVAEFPSDDGEPPRTLKEYEDRGLGAARLAPLDRSELVDWHCDAQGFAWGMTYTTTTTRPTVKDPHGEVVEEWRHYDRDNVTTFTLRYASDRDRPPPATDVPMTSQAPHGFRRVPIIAMRLPEEMCLGKALRDPAVRHFRLDSMLMHGYAMTCYAMPVIKTEDDDDADPIMGAGYAIKLKPGDSFEWSAPPAESFQEVRKARDSARDEMYRIAHTLQAGLDNNAETVGRSAESKAADSSATRIQLSAYGAVVAAAIEAMLETLSEARGDVDHEWSVTLGGYDTTTTASLLDSVQRVRDLGFGERSPTLMTQLATKVAASLLPDVDQRVHDTIRAELEAKTSQMIG